MWIIKMKLHFKNVYATPYAIRTRKIKRAMKWLTIHDTIHIHNNVEKKDPPNNRGNKSNYIMCVFLPVKR